MTFLKKTLCMLGALAFAAGLLGAPADAAPKEVKFLFPEPYTSAYSYPEGQAMGMYFGILDFQMRNHPTLRGKYKMRWVGDIYKSPEDVLNAVATGAGEMTYTLPHFIEQFDPEWRVLTVPGMFRDIQHFLRAMNTPVWKEKQDSLARNKGFRILKWVNGIGDFHIYLNKGPADSFEALRDLKVRFAGQQSFANAFKALGFVGVAMPYTEVISSLQTNMIDGHVDNIYSHDYYDMPRTCKYVIPLPLAVMPMALVVSSAWWDSLSDAERTVIDFTINSIDTLKYFDENQANVLTWWEENNGVVVRMSPEFQAEWKKRIADANKDFIKDVDPALLEAIQSTAQ